MKALSVGFAVVWAAFWLYWLVAAFSVKRGRLAWGPELRIRVVIVLVAIWARRYLGRNWGTPMTRKRDPELVTGGPYARIRHPIYTGILTAGVGTAVALSWVGLVPVALAAIYFIYSARVEERFMTQMFPEAYPAYQRRTKMLLPFLL